MFACTECGCVGVCGCASVCVCCVLGVYVCESVWLFGPQQKGNVYKSLFDTSDLRNLTSTPSLQKKEREKEATVSSKEASAHYDQEIWQLLP